VLQQGGRHEEAGLAFERALTLDPRLDRAWYGLALVRIHQQRWGEAAEALERNTALQPLGPHGWYRLAQVWLALGETGKARKVIAHLRRFEPRVAAQLERENAETLRTDKAPDEAVHAAG
jgi:tetratricopeptide (TPR) repeat protein